MRVVVGFERRRGWTRVGEIWWVAANELFNSMLF